MIVEKERESVCECAKDDNDNDNYRLLIRIENMKYVNRIDCKKQDKREREGELHESHNEADIGIDIGL